MKNLFKSPEQLIAEIHNEVDTAQERLLQEALNVLSNGRENVENIGDRLRRVGFVNTPVAKKSSEIKHQKKISREQAALIQYYQQTYPFLKFLTEDELNRICEKYKLIHAPVSAYEKDVPEKNLRDIETAQPLRDADTNPKFIHLVGGRYSYNEQGKIDALLELAGLRNGTFSEKDIKNVMPRYGMNPDFYLIDSNTWLYVIWDKLGRPDNTYYGFESIEFTDKSGLFIAAPPSHFNLKGLDRKSKHGFFQVFKTEVKDPIVFRYVRGGVQVLTKWGLEANDPSLVVPVLN
jgi:hypothetical protein